MTPWLCALLLLSLLAPSDAAARSCSPIPPVACEKCFAVAILPDTQLYSDLGHQPHGAAHLDLVTRYLCRESRGFVEPSTGKQMPIAMVLQLGDLVQGGDRSEELAGSLAEWRRVDAAFDRLDACTPRVPYLVTNGNHDVARWNYEGASVGYDEFFGAQRWKHVACADPARCDWDAGEWFIGGVDPIVAGSRNHVGEGSPGPTSTSPGRHRAGVIRAPNGQRFLFLGLEMAFDFPPAAVPPATVPRSAAGFEVVQGDDSAWPKRVLRDYAGVPTIVFHHSLFLQGPPLSQSVEFGPETWHADRLEATGMRAIWDEILAPSPQVLLVFAGHVIRPTHQGDYTIAREGAPPVHGFLRNYQDVGLEGTPGPSQRYGVGWNVMAVFDPDAGEIRVRSYRIDDADAYASPPIDLDHAGEAIATECMEMDQGGVGERIIAVDFDALGGR